MQIELIYVILFSIITVIGILGATKKMSMGIALIGIGLGLTIAYIFAPYMEIVMSPLTQAIWYGATWGLGAFLAVGHIASLIFLVVVAAYNLMSSGGKIVWA